MAFSNPETEKYANELQKAGLLDANIRKRLEIQEGIAARDEGVARKYIDKKSQITIEQVMDVVDTKLRTSDYEALETINSEYSVDTPDRMEDWQTKLGDWTGENLTPSRLAAFAFLGPIGGASTVAAAEAVGATGAKLSTGGDLGIREERTSVNDFYRLLQEAGYEVSRPDISMFPEAAMYGADVGPDTIKSAIEYASTKGDVPPDVLDYVMDQVEEAALDREMARQSTEERLTEEEAVDRTNEENPTYAKNLAAYQILDNAHPTKYKFDKESGAIYLTETGYQVDRSGNEIDQFDTEAASNLVGGWPDDVPKIFNPDPLGTGWGKMTAETGIQVDEAGYMDVLDVINNKEWYGADPSRYLSGQQFLGNFDSSYMVKVEETDVMRRTRSTFDTIGTESEARSALGGYVWDAMNDDLQSIRRPWYDPDDNWAQFAGLSPENVRAVQERMISVDALDPDDVVFGVWGPTEAAQMEKWMTIANGQAVEWTEVDEDILKEYFERQEASTTPRAAFVPQPYRPMDPARVELTVKDSVRALLGRAATDEDLQILGGYLTDEYSSSYVADVQAGRAQYDAQGAANESGASFAQPGAVEDVDYEARYIQQLEERFKPQTESLARGELAGKQQDMGVAMSNLMNRLGGGLG